MSDDLVQHTIQKTSLLAGETEEKTPLMNYGNLQPASRLGRSIVTQIATAQTNATQSTTPFGSQTQHARLVSTLALWATIDSTAVVTANSAAALIPANVPEYFGCSPGQVLNFISTSTSTGYVTLTEVT